MSITTNLRAFKLSFFLLLSFILQAKIINPVKWSTEVSRESSEYLLKMTAKLEDGWHIYSQKIPEGGPIATSFNVINPNNGVFKVIGGVTEPKPIIKFDEMFEVDVAYFENQVMFTQKINLMKPTDNIDIDVSYMLCGEGACLPPKTKTLSFNMDNHEPTNADSDYWSIFWVSFLSGFLALLTPCMFPMIPLTISFFTKEGTSSWKNLHKEILYGLSIIFIYTGLGYLVTVIFGADTLNRFSTSVGFNLFFFLLLIVFAISFFGAFNIELPASWANALDKRSRKGGFLGIFFMALVLVVVSFSCTGPIIGTLLVQAAMKGGLYPLFGMLGFSTALSLPFMFFATFPSFLKSLPKSGSWMEMIKISLGFIELAFAVKFLSNIDLVLQLHWLERELFIAIWMSIFLVFALFLLGILRLNDDERFQKVTPLRLFIGTIVLSFSLYLSTGLFGKTSLHFLSGILPPENYSTLKTDNILSTAEPESLSEGMTKGPHGVGIFEDYKEALEYARKNNKPLLIDFTGHACANCRQMEDRVWGQHKILRILKNDVIFVSLFVDDKRKLPKHEIYKSKLTGNWIKTIGAKWSEFQAQKYNANTQPFYVLVDHSENKLQEPIAYTMDNKRFENWLNTGIQKFKKGISN